MQASDSFQRINPAKNLTDLNVPLLSLLTKGNTALNPLNLVFFLIGLAFFANLIAAAFNYIFSDGSADKVAKANTRILNSLVGLAIVFTAFVIVRLVLGIIGIQP